MAHKDAASRAETFALLWGRTYKNDLKSFSLTQMYTGPILYSVLRKFDVIRELCYLPKCSKM
jgi:hypothetical protein